jgi:hypothetical protein
VAAGVYPDELIASSSSGFRLPAAFLPALLCLRGLI